MSTSRIGDRAGQAMRAWVGGDAAPAGEYHDNDFSWEEHRREVVARGLAAPEDAQERPDDEPCCASGRPEDEAGAAADQGSWEAFHRRDNASARFYKERRYLLLEFPVLAEQSRPQHFAEIGCGAGSSLLPVLKANAHCRVTATDLSPTAVAMLRQAAASAGIAAHRVHAFAHDSTRMDGNASPFRGLQADAMLLIFTLAAVRPHQMLPMLRNAFEALRPGGLLLLRDHGLYDITHLRLTPQQRVGHRLFRRQDGTECYFFTLQDLQRRMHAAGFETVECKYACVALRNRRQQLDMKRVFVHGVFRKPEAASDVSAP